MIKTDVRWATVIAMLVFYLTYSSWEMQIFGFHSNLPHLLRVRQARKTEKVRVVRRRMEDYSES